MAKNQINYLKQASLAHDTNVPVGVNVSKVLLSCVTSDKQLIFYLPLHSQPSVSENTSYLGRLVSSHKSNHYSNCVVLSSVNNVCSTKCM